MAHTSHTLMGVRIPSDLKNQLAIYCGAHGIKIHFFVTQAIREKFLSVMEDHNDIALATQRLHDPKDPVISHQQMKTYLKKRGVK